jgi:hypothetical protein
MARAINNRDQEVCSRMVEFEASCSVFERVERDRMVLEFRHEVVARNSVTGSNAKNKSRTSPIHNNKHLGQQ